jgi:hypothetical protein
MSKILQDVFEHKGDLRSPTIGDLFHFFNDLDVFFSIKKKI